LCYISSMHTPKDAPLSDLILYNADILTLDPMKPRAELVAVRGGMISHVGNSGEFGRLESPTSRIIDCRGNTVVPGFIDAHFHVTSFAESLVTLNLGPHRNVRSVSDIQAKIRESSQGLAPGTWIRCGGYNEFYLREGRHPNRWDLDSVSSVHPIKLTHRSGHAHVLNSLALQLTGISKETAEPDGGMIDRDIETGEPTGLLYGMGDFLSTVVPHLDAHQLEVGIERANRELLSVGITCIHDASSRNDRERWEMFRRWKAEGRFTPRIRMMLGTRGFEEYQRRKFLTDTNGKALCVTGVKIILDETTGRLNPSQAELNDLMLSIHQSGLQVIIHAIEETTVEAACAAIAYALERSPRSDHRHRIEHCSVCPPPLAKEVASLRAIVVTQPSFIYYSGDRYLKTVPPSQLKYLYPIATLMENGVTVAGSSDCPLVPPDPLIGIYAAISRMSHTGQGIAAREGIPPLDALRMYTVYAARASFEERILGSISAGKLGDLVVLSGDPTTISTEAIKDIQVEMTVLDGKVVWDRDGLADDTPLKV
jgi:predicted amidohydrolase YtcJ